MSHSKLLLPRIYPIIDDSIAPLEKIEETAKAIIAGGAQILQLRAKRLSSEDFLEAARTVRNMTRDKGIIFIINDRVDITMMADADGVHLGQDDLPVKEARRLLGKDKIIGWSTHNIREAAEAGRLPIDYISFGPIFSTKTKGDAQTPKGIKGLAEARKVVNIPIVAIGGITEKNMVYVLKEGANSAAMISEILTSSDVSKKVSKLISMAKNLQANGK